ncbi:hypothetical protein SDC9_88627 [bioreactor metagenome]|uniref:Uncharacterized protein n=1 Tax=bioreactor metagenome TaxID=1076179 RepID=A0A644ZM33_9ZZZZ
MGSGNHIDIGRPHLLQIDHHQRKFLNAELNTKSRAPIVTLVGNLMILAECTVQGTATEEDHPRSMFTGYRRFLPLMQA